MARRRGLFSRIVNAVRNIFRPTPPAPSPAPPPAPPPLRVSTPVQPGQRLPQFGRQWSTDKQRVFDNFVANTGTERLRTDPVLRGFMDALYMGRDRDLARGQRSKNIKHELDEYLHEEYDLEFDDWFDWQDWRDTVDT